MFEFHFRKGALVGALALAIAITASAALAQYSHSSSPSTTSSISNTASEVKEWTLKKWRAAKREWRKDKAKWEACNGKAADQKLKGRASWSFIYTCMTAS